MSATRNGTPAVRDAARTLHPGVAAQAAVAALTGYVAMFERNP